MRWLALSAAIILFDQVTKHIAAAALELHTPVEVLPFLDFTLTYNPGAAFSFLSDAGGWQRWLFVGLSVLVSIFIVAWLRQLPRGRLLLPCALALVLGGALGNLWDRLVIGEVVDFIVLYYRDWAWPAFNVADSAISLGVVLLLLSALRKEEEAG